MWVMWASLFVNCQGLERWGVVMMMMTGVIAAFARWLPSELARLLRVCGPITTMPGHLSPQHGGKAHERWVSQAWT